MKSPNGAAAGRPGSTALPIRPTAWGPVLQWFDGQRVISVPRAGSGHHHRDARDDAYEHENTCLMLCRMSGGGLVKIRIDMLSDRPHNMAGYALQGTMGCYESSRGLDESDKIWL